MMIFEFEASKFTLLVQKEYKEVFVLNMFHSGSKCFLLLVNNLPQNHAAFVVILGDQNYAFRRHFLGCIEAAVG